MLFTAHVTVETTHTESNKKEQILKIAHGIITWVSVFHQEGSNCMVHAAIFHHEHQVFPSTEGMTIVGDGTPVEWIEYYESYQPPYELKIKAWGVGTSFDHTFHVRIAVLPRKAIIALAIVDAIKSLFGRLMPVRLEIPSWLGGSKEGKES